MADLGAVGTYVPVFPVGPGVYSGSAVVCRDGRVLYVYVAEMDYIGRSGGGEVRGTYFRDITDFAFAATDQTDEGYPRTYRTGKPIEGSDHAIIPNVVRAASSVWWGGDTLYLTVTYAEGAWATGAVTMQLKAEMWTSPSGNGGDWELVGNLADPTEFTGLAAYMHGSQVGRAGVGTATASGFVVPLMKWIPGNGLGWARPTVVSGSGGSWEQVHEHRYYIGGQYGHAISRRVVPHLGAVWFNSGGNVEFRPAGGGDAKGDHGAISYDGATWEDYPDLPIDQDNDRPYLISANGLMHRATPSGFATSLRPQIQVTVDPRVGGWQTITPPLNMGHITNGELIGRTGAYLWLEMSPGYWALFNHDKVWFVFGGWVLGALGRS